MEGRTVNYYYGDGPMQSNGDCVRAVSKFDGETAPAAESTAATLMSHLTGAQGDTHGAISRLEARLSAVLLPEGSSTCGPPKDNAEPVASPLCAELACRIETEHGAYRRIHALIDRLTV